MTWSDKMKLPYAQKQKMAARPTPRPRRAAMVSFTTSARSDALMAGAVMLDMFYDPATSQYYAYTRLGKITPCLDTDRRLRAAYADVRDIVHGASYDKWLDYMAMNFPLGRGDGHEGPIVSAAALEGPRPPKIKQRQRKRRNDDFEGGALLQRAPTVAEVVPKPPPTMNAFERRRRSYGEHGEQFAALVAEYSARPVPPAEALARAALAAQWTGAFSVHRGASCAPAIVDFATLYARYKTTAAPTPTPAAPAATPAAMPTKPLWDPRAADTLLVDALERLATDRVVERARDCLPDLTQHNRQGAALLREALMHYDAAGYLGGRAMAEEARREHGTTVARLLRTYTMLLDDDGVGSVQKGWDY
jgi:hypothetical protein